MSHTSDDPNKPNSEHPLSSHAPTAMNNEDALEKGLLLENQAARNPITSPIDGPDSSPSALMLSIQPNEHIIPEDSAPIEPPKEIKQVRRDTRPLSPDQQTLLQSPLAKKGVSLGLTENPIGNVPQDLQSDIPASLDQYTAFWKAYNDDADAQDKEIVESLGGDLDALLIFAGLFSASNVAFIVEAYKDLKQDNVDTTNDLLRTLIHNQISPSNPLAAESARFSVTPRAIRVNALFFTSLSCSLLTALGAVLGKQWLNHYKREGRRMTLAERGRERQTKYMGLERWHLEQVVETLPTLLQLSLFLFLGALIDFLWPINRTIAGVIAGFSIITFCFYVITTTIAVLFPSAPFQTRFSALVRTSRIAFLRFLTWIQKLIPVVSLRLKCRTYWIRFSSFFVRRKSHQSRTVVDSPRVRSRSDPHSIQYDSASDDLSARVVQITSPQPVIVHGKISKMFGDIGRFLKRRSSSSPQGPVNYMDSVLSKDDLSCKCISWVLETSSVDKTLSLAATAALMLPERGWEKIDTLDEIPRVLRLVLGARAFESKVILDVHPGTVKAVLQPLHAVVMKWDHTTELIVPTLGDNASFVMNFEHLLWRVVRAYPVEGMAAVWILQMLVKLEFSVEPRREDIVLLYRYALEVFRSHLYLDAVLGYVVLLESSMSLHSINEFLAHDLAWTFNIADLLQPLHGSMILLDGNRFLRIGHPSMRSFFADPTSCQNPNIASSTARHTVMALNCVQIMTSGLRRNILGTDNHLLLNKDIVDLEAKLTGVGRWESLQYACRHWATHLQFSSRRDPRLRDAMQAFCTVALLPWLEIMSLLGCYDETLSMIVRAETWTRAGDSTNVTMSLLEDMHRFITLFEGLVKPSAAAIYSVALPLAYPSELQTYYRKQTTSLKIHPEGPVNLWTSTHTLVSPHIGMEVAALAVSHDNKYILSGADDGMVQLFTMRDGKCIATFEGHNNSVPSAVFAPDNNTIVSGSWDGSIKIWDAAAHSLNMTLVGHRDWVRAVNVSPDSRYIVSGGDDETVRLWDASTGSHIAAMAGHRDLVLAVIFSPDGHKILSGSRDGKVRIWNRADQTLLATLNHSSLVFSIAFSSDGMRIASGGKSNTVKIWDAESHLLIRMLEGPLESVTSLAFFSDSRFVVTGCADGTIRVWDILEGSVQSILEGHTDWIYNISFTPDQRYIVSASRDNSVRTWNWEDADSSLIKTPMGHTSRIAVIAFCSNGRILASGGDNGEVHIWNVDGMVHVVRLDGLSDRVESITFSSGGEYITASESFGLIISWDLSTHQIISGPTSSDLSRHSSPEHSIVHGSGEGACSSAVECQLALKSGVVYVKKFSAGHEMRSKKLLTLPVPNISASRCHGYHLAVGTKGGRIMILDFSSIISFETTFDEEVTDHKSEIQGSAIDAVMLRSSNSSAVTS